MAVYKRPDPVLMEVIDDVDGRDTPIKLTLHMPGMVVYGTLLSTQQFVESLYTDEQITPDRLEDLATITQREKRASERRQELTETASTEGRYFTDDEWAEVDRLSRTFIHLQDVVIVGPGGPEFRTRLWRGQRLDVMGWISGSIPEFN